MHSDTNSSRQLGPRSIHTWAGNRYWQENEYAWLISCRTGVSKGLDGESRVCHESTQEGEVWRGVGVSARGRKERVR